jgi:hypothetical protein
MKLFLLFLISLYCHADLVQPNDSYLNDTKFTEKSVLTQDDLISNKKVQELTQQYDMLNNPYALKQQYGLVDMQTESAYESQMTNFSHTVWQALQQKQSHEQFQKLKDTINSNETLSVVAKPGMAVGAIVAFYQGQPLDIKLSSDSKVTTITNFPAQMASVRVHSSDFDGSLDYNNNPVLPPDMSPYGTVEQYRASVSKGIALGVSAGTTYGSTSTYLTSFVRRGIYKNVVGELDYVDPTSALAASLRSPEEAIKVSYGVNF